MNTAWALVIITKGLLWGYNSTTTEYATVEECLTKRNEFYLTPEGDSSFAFCIELDDALKLGYR